MKKDGEVRICVDMRQANTAIQRHRTPLPTTDEMFDLLWKAQYFSKLDLKWGFHQILLSDDSREITTFITHCGLYHYKRLSFGISSAPETFHMIIRELLRDCPGSTNFLDDVVIYGSTRDEHDRNLHRVLDVFRNRGLTLNKEKCQFCVRSIEFMGQIVSPDGLSIADCKVRAILNAEAPKNVTELRSFLGLVQFCSRFAKGLANDAEPLNSLL